MDTVEARTSPTGQAGGPVYDAFLSYSHAADDLLAPRLQAGLQRFAKPWWKRQILRVFRDEGSLSANPHLWGSITEAMDGSGWFVPLLSPEAAASEWVKREVEWWLDNKDPGRIIPVVTDGDFGWANGDVTGVAVPPALHGAFADEPRWVDLRFARSEAQLDLRNARFRDAIADIASGIRGIPKDELESEEIRQHRRTVRTAWASGLVVVVFALIAAAAALFALDQRNDAQRQAEIAQAERDRAEAAAEAEAEQRASAEASFALARGRELSMLSEDNLEADPERSILLALQGLDTANAVGQTIEEPVTALREALTASRVVSRFAGGTFVAYSPDGRSIVTGLGADAALWDTTTDERQLVLPTPEGRWATRAAFSPDGTQLAVTYRSIGETGPLAILLWDVAAGEVTRSFDGPESIDSLPVFSPDGRLLTADSQGPLIAWDVTTGAVLYRIDPAPGGHVWGPAFNPSGTLLAAADNSDAPRVVLHDPQTGAELDSLDVGVLNPIATAFDPTGRYLAALSQLPSEVVVWDLERGEQIADIPLQSGPVALTWHPDGQVLAVSGNEGIPRLFDVATGTELLALLGIDDLVWSVAFSPDGQELAGAGFGGQTTLVWDITPSGVPEVAAFDTPYVLNFARGVQYDAAHDHVLVMGSEGPQSTVAVLDAATGDILAELTDQLAVWPPIPLLFPKAGLVAGLDADGRAVLRDAETLAPVASVPAGWFVLAVSPDGTRVLLSTLDLTDAEVVEAGSWETLMDIGGTLCFGDFSPDGSLLSAYDCRANGDGLIIDVDNETFLARIPPPVDVDDPGWLPGPFSPDGSLLTMRTSDGRFGLLDVAALRLGADIDDAMAFPSIDAHDGIVPDNVPFSPDGTLFATWGLNDHHLRVWTTAAGELVADLGEIPNWPGFDFYPDSRHLIVGRDNGTVRIYTLDTDELVDIAHSRLTRTFTTYECTIYSIDPCPTLEEIRSR